MPAPRQLLLVGTVLAATVALSSCGLDENAVGNEEAGPQRAKVVILVPGGESATGTAAGVIDSARVALEQGLDDLAGWSVQVEAVDDGADPRHVAESIVDDDVVAVIGGLSGGTVRAVQPVLDAAEVIFVSPADVDPTHTRGADQTAPLRPYQTYFRTAVDAAEPAEALTRFAVRALAASRVAVFDGGDAPAAARLATSARHQGG
ncbi:MAG: ABC transporter substrate-binding protein, partial [Jiangellaceae bacterium]